MNEPEVREWLTYHYSCFPAVHKFVRQEPGTEQIWGEIVSEIPELRHATMVSKMMVTGELIAPHYTEHPQFVVDAAKLQAYKESSAKRSADEQSTRQHGEVCGLCRGSGGVNVWPVMAHKRMRDGWDQATGRFPGWNNNTSCACKCSQGDKFRRIVKRHGKERPWSADYDERYFVLCKNASDPESIQALQDFEGVAATVEAGDGVKGQAWKF